MNPFLTVLRAGLLYFLAAAQQPTYAAEPTWWARSGLKNENVANDHAVATIGQAMHAAGCARNEFDASFSIIGGAGKTINEFIRDYDPSRNSQAIRLGQLKRISSLYWQRLVELGIYAAVDGKVPYPWTEGSDDDQDKALATLGQVKTVFSFITDADTDADGLPDWWEREFYGDLMPLPNDDPDTDGISNLIEFQKLMNPKLADGGVKTILIGSSRRGVSTFGTWSAKNRTKRPANQAAQALLDEYQISKSGYVDVWPSGPGGQSDQYIFGRLYTKPGLVYYPEVFKWQYSGEKIEIKLEEGINRNPGILGTGASTEIRVGAHHSTGSLDESICEYSQSPIYYIKNNSGRSDLSLISQQYLDLNGTVRTRQGISDKSTFQNLPRIGGYAVPPAGMVWPANGSSNQQLRLASHWIHILRLQTGPNLSLAFNWSPQESTPTWLLDLETSLGGESRFFNWPTLPPGKNFIYRVKIHQAILTPLFWDQTPHRLTLDVRIACLDSDSDGMPDYSEMSAGSDPFDADDNDNFLPDALEEGMQGIVSDSDGDGFPDWHDHYLGQWDEVQFGGNPANTIVGTAEPAALVREPIHTTSNFAPSAVISPEWKWSPAFIAQSNLQMVGNGGDVSREEGGFIRLKPKRSGSLATLELAVPLAGLNADPHPFPVTGAPGVKQNRFLYLQYRWRGFGEKAVAQEVNGDELLFSIPRTEVKDLPSALVFNNAYLPEASTFLRPESAQGLIYGNSRKFVAPFNFGTWLIGPAPQYEDSALGSDSVERLSAAHAIGVEFSQPRAAINHPHMTPQTWPAVNEPGWHTITLKFDLLEGSRGSGAAPTTMWLDEKQQGFLPALLDLVAVVNPNPLIADQLMLKRFSNSSLPVTLQLRWNGSRIYPVDVSGIYVGLANPLFDDPDHDGIPYRGYLNGQINGFLEATENPAKRQDIWEDAAPHVDLSSRNLHQVSDAEADAYGDALDAFGHNRRNSAKSKSGILYTEALESLPAGFYSKRKTGWIYAVEGADLDSDEDGIPDKWELLNFDTLADCAPDGDMDGDSYSNLFEFEMGTDPNAGGDIDPASDPERSDMDKDGIPDQWELMYFPSLETCIPTADPDNDGISNILENELSEKENFMAAFNPTIRDDDPFEDANGDRLTNLAAKILGFQYWDPVRQGGQDPDGDGLMTADEVTSTGEFIGTGPFRALRQPRTDLVSINPQPPTPLLTPSQISSLLPEGTSISGPNDDDADNDGVKNMEDAVPYDPNITFAPVPEAKYIVMPLANSEGIVEQGTPVAINNAGHVLLRPLAAASNTDAGKMANQPARLWMGIDQAWEVELPGNVPHGHIAYWLNAADSKQCLDLADDLSPDGKPQVLAQGSWVQTQNFQPGVGSPHLTGNHAFVWSPSGGAQWLPYGFPAMHGVPHVWQTVGSPDSGDCVKSTAAHFLAGRVIGDYLLYDGQNPDGRSEEFFSFFSWQKGVADWTLDVSSPPLQGYGRSYTSNDLGWLEGPKYFKTFTSLIAFRESLPHENNYSLMTKARYFTFSNKGKGIWLTSGNPGSNNPSPYASGGSYRQNPGAHGLDRHAEWKYFLNSDAFGAARTIGVDVELPVPVGITLSIVGGPSMLNDMADQRATKQAYENSGNAPTYYHPYTTGPFIVGSGSSQAGADLLPTGYYWTQDAGSLLTGTTQSFKTGKLIALPADPITGEPVRYFTPDPWLVRHGMNERGEILGYVNDIGPDKKYGAPAIWRNGLAHSLDNLQATPQEESNYTSILGQAINDEGVIAATAIDRRDGKRTPVRLVPIELVLHPILANGSISPKSASGIQTSLPSPKVNVSNLQVGNLSTDESGRIIADITVTGTVTSQVCDTIKGPDGEIDKLDFYVNGEANEDGGGFSSINLTTSKTDDGPVGKPYPYVGSFSSKKIQAVPLVEGVNTFELSAQDKIYGNPGFSRWSVTVSVPQQDSDTIIGTAYTLTVSMVADTPLTQINEVTVTFTAGVQTATNHTFVRDSGFSGDRFTSSIGGVAHFLELDEFEDPSSSLRNGLAAVHRIGAASNPGYRIELLETEASSGAFFGAYQAFTVAGSADPVILARHGEIEVTNGGEFHSYALELKLPERIPLGASPTIKMGEDEFAVKTHEDSGLLLVQNPQDSNKAVVASFVMTPKPAPPTSAEEQEILNSLQNANFAEGFAKGIGVGGTDMVVGIGSLVKGTGKWMGRGFLWSGGMLTMGVQKLFGIDTSDSFELTLEIAAPNQEVLNDAISAAKMLQPLAELALDNLQVVQDMQIALLTGNLDAAGLAWARGGEVNEKLLSFAGEAISDTLEEFKDSGQGVKGYMVGRVVFEAAMVLIPFSNGGKLAQLTKSTFLIGLSTKLTAAGGRLQTVVAAKASIRMGALLTTKMCFVAGTPIHTDEGLKNIEAIQPGDLVWSRDEFTGEYGWRPVVETFVTHPSEVHHLTYIVRGPPGGGAKTETLGVTAPHPFWVQNRPRPAFFPAGELKPGDVLSLADGGTAEVLARTVEKSPGGQSFTTYNFEVAGFHTYFAGTHGVWVHNFSAKFCEEFFSLIEGIRKKLGITENDVSGKRFLLFSEAVKLRRVADAKDANFALHVTGVDEIADYARRFGTHNPNNPVNEIWSYTQQKAVVKKFGAANFEIHHLGENRITKAFGITNRANRDASPSINLPERASDFTTEDFANYRAKFGRDPVFHQGPDGITDAITAIFQQRGIPYDVEVSGPQKSFLLNDLKVLYTQDVRFKHLDLWPATRDWLKQTLKATGDDVLVPN